MSRGAAWALVSVALAALAAFGPPAAGQAPEEAFPSGVAIVAWHPFPDLDAQAGRGGDPFGIPAEPGAARDRMGAYYGAEWFPTVRFDGVRESSYAKDASLDDARGFERTYREHVTARLAEDSPLVLTLASDGRDPVRVTLRIVPKVDVDSARLAVRVALVEDGIAFSGGNGVDAHDHVARHAFAPSIVGPLAAGEPVELAWNVTRPDPARAYPDARWGEELDVVAFVQNEDASATGWLEGEVLQSATFRAGQAGPTVQASKSVLVEMYTATWCASCLYGDAALAAIARDFTVASADAEATRYWRPAGATELVVGACLTVGLAFALWPRKGGA